MNTNEGAVVVKFGSLKREKKRKRAEKAMECLVSVVSRHFFLRDFFLLV